MQTRSVRASVIALCTLAALTACEQKNSISQSDSAPDSDSTTSRDSAATDDTTTPATAQASRPETLNPERSSRLNTSIGNLPSLSSRAYLPPPQTSILPRLSTTPNPIPRSTWQLTPRTLAPTVSAPSAAAPTRMPDLIAPPASTTAPARLNQATDATSSPGPSTAATANLPPAIAGLNAAVTPAVETATEATTDPTRSPALSDLQGHWAQPFITTLANIGIIQGFPDGTFLPDEPITQDQFTAMVQRAFPDEAIDPEQIPLKPETTRAEAARVIYQALVDQGKVSPIASQIATATQPFNASSPTAVTNADPVRPSTSPTAEPGAIAAATPPLSSNPSSALQSDAQADPQATTVTPSTDPQAAPQISPSASSEPVAVRQTEANPEIQPELAVPELATPEAVRPETIELGSVDLAELDNSGPQTPSSPAPEAIPAERPAPVPASESPVSESSASENSVPESSVSEGSRAPETAAVTVAVMGEVSQPGAYRLIPDGTPNGQPTLIQAIQMAGGVTASANIRQIQVQRASAENQIITLDLWQILQTGSLAQGEIVLQPGDRITIPKASTLNAEINPSANPATPDDRIQVSIVGEVNKPGRLELPSNTSVNQAILASGGLNSQARKAELIRLNPNGTVARRAIAVDGAQDLNTGNPALRNDDVILVYRTVAATTASSPEPKLSALLSILPGTSAVQ